MGFMCLPGHISIPENKAVDQLAKESLCKENFEVNADTGLREVMSMCKGKLEALQQQQ